MSFYNNHKHFVYILLNNESVVYVGVSAHPSWRYKEHHYDTLSTVYHFARYLLSLGTPLKLQIVDSAPSKKAGHKLEMMYIIKYSLKYHLLNDKDNFFDVYSIIPKLNKIVNSPLLDSQKSIIQNMEKEWENR